MVPKGNSILYLFYSEQYDVKILLFAFSDLLDITAKVPVFVVSCIIYYFEVNTFAVRGYL